MRCFCDLYYYGVSGPYSDVEPIHTNHVRVILNVNANPESITKFHDELSNELPNLKGHWNFSFKIFRNNQYSIPPHKVHQLEVSDEINFLHTLAPSYLPESCISLINQRSSAVFTNLIHEEVNDVNDHLLTIPDHHLHHGATTGLNDPFDMFITNKLQSLWNLKQIIRGDGGQIYELENGNLTIRTSNVFLHGIFKGLLIEIIVDDHVVEKKTSDYLKSLFDKIITNYKIPSGKICYQLLAANNFDKFGDLCLQYSEILNF